MKKQPPYTSKQKVFRQQSLDQLKNFTPSQAKTNLSDSIEKNYTLIARLPQMSIKKFRDLYKQINQIDPGQYLYSANNLHLTLIGKLNQNQEPTTLVQQLQSILSQHQLKFHLYGINSYIYHSSVCAYPLGFSLHKFRQQIRNTLKDKGDDYSKYLPAYDYVGWINFLRYQHQPAQPLLDFYYQQKDQSFGIFRPRIIDLLSTTSKLLKQSDTQLIHRFYV